MFLTETHLVALYSVMHLALDPYTVDTIQDFLRKLGMKPHVHLVEISIFSLNNVIIRPTKIIKDLCKAST